MIKIKQMSLVDFMSEYGMKRSCTLMLINRRSDPLPAYKLGGQWYVDIQAFEQWRVEEHKRQYKYA
jgi:hypothetical protein